MISCKSVADVLSFSMFFWELFSDFKLRTLIDRLHRKRYVLRILPYLS